MYLSSGRDVSTLHTYNTNNSSIDTLCERGITNDEKGWRLGKPGDAERAIIHRT
jgi:hypothetical protein